MKAKYALEAVIYEYEAGTEDEYEKIKAVPQDKVVATVEGTWKGQVTWKRKGDKVRLGARMCVCFSLRCPAHHRCIHKGRPTTDRFGAAQLHLA